MLPSRKSPILKQKCIYPLIMCQAQWEQIQWRWTKQEKLCKSTHWGSLTFWLAFPGSPGGPGTPVHVQVTSQHILSATDSWGERKVHNVWNCSSIAVEVTGHAFQFWGILPQIHFIEARQIRQLATRTWHLWKLETHLHKLQSKYWSSWNGLCWSQCGHKMLIIVHITVSK